MHGDSGGTSVAGDDVMTVGLLGAGGIARAHLPSLLSLGVDVLVYSADGREGELIAECGGGVSVSKEEILLRADVVDICTPTFTHRDLVLECAESGKDVICEKPLGLTAEESEEMIRACEAAGVRLYPAHVVRYFGAYRTLHDASERGGLGEIAVQRFVRGGARPQAPWFADDDRSGGIILDQMIHDLDIALWIAGPVARIFARQIDRGAGSVCVAHVILTHEGGALTAVTGFWGAQGVIFRTSFDVAGTKGLAAYDSGARSPVEVDIPKRIREGGGLLPAVSFEESPYRMELADFLRGIRRGVPTAVTADDGLSAVRLARLARESAYTGRAIAVLKERNI